MIRKATVLFASLFFIAAAIGITVAYFKFGKIIPYYIQLSRNRVGANLDLQPPAQKTAAYLGSDSCKECHEDNYSQWRSSRHSMMIRDVAADPSAIIGDFSVLPDDADFEKKDIVFVIGK